MKKMIIYILVLMLCITVYVPIEVSSTTAYSDGYVKIGDTVIPFPEYMPGSYFTKNGQACTCHYNNAIDCIASGPYCNCTRFINIDGEDIDLLSVQCIGFARYCFYRLFGFADTYLNTALFYNAGTLSYGQVTATTVKNLISSVKPGAHIRFKLANSEHSVILLSQNNDGFTVYQCNSGGNGIPNSSCIISTKTYTWESFATYAYRGVLYANMPYNYPSDVVFSDTPFYEENTYTPGMYTLTANLRLRAGSGTEFEQIDVIPEGTNVVVSKTANGWGVTEYNGSIGWISLEFTEFLGFGSTLYPKTDSVYIKEGCIFGLESGINGKELLNFFYNTELSTDCADEAIVCTGTTVIIKDGDEVVYTATAIIDGDVNCDGILSTADLAMIKAHLSNISILENEAFHAADLSRNNTLNTTDYKVALKTLSSK